MGANMEGDPYVWLEDREGVWFVATRNPREPMPRLMMPNLARREAERAERLGAQRLADMLRDAAEDARAKNTALPSWKSSCSR